MSDRTYCVYIVASRSHTLYTGVRNNLVRRIYEHKRGLIAGFTKKYRINRLVYFEVFGDVRAAIAREKQVKSWTRAKRIALIEANNPTWDDLAEDWARRWDRVERRIRTAEGRNSNADPSLRSG
jgi:putative endonuclease